jgi:hypothetical protein
VDTTISFIVSGIIAAHPEFHLATEGFDSMQMRLLTANQIRCLQGALEQDCHGGVMRTVLFASFVTVGLWVSVAVAQNSTSTVASSLQALKLTGAEQAVWEQEETYWRLVKADNRQGYLDLWDDRFVGWPRFENNPIHKDVITRFMSERKILDYRLEPLSVREFGENVVITLYRATVHSRDSTGANESTHASRLTHTWMKTEKGWRIIGGMSADDVTTALSPSPQKAKP